MNKLLVGLLLSVGIGSASAANWISQDSENFIDVHSVVFDSNTQTRGAWLKMLNSNGRTDITRINVYCPTKMVRYSENHIYAGTTYITTEYYPTNQWNYVIPGTLAEQWANMVCNSKIAK